MVTVRILDGDHARLRELAAITGKPQQDILHEALEAYAQHVMLDAINAGFSALRKDGPAWQEEQAERRAWAGTSLDGTT